MNRAMLKKLASKGESATVEFKKSTADLQGACESLCCMLNAGLEARVFIGIAGGKIVGQEVTDRSQQEIAQFLKNFIPDPQIKISFVSRRTIQRELQLLKAKNKVMVSGQGTNFTFWMLV
jgi:ATP-dependent DNA helicase RecG